MRFQPLHRFRLVHFLALLDTSNSFLFHHSGVSDSRMPPTTPTISTSPTSVLALTGAEDPAGLGEKNKDIMLRATMSDDLFNEMVTAPRDPRSCILEVGAAAGKLCSVANRIMVPERIINDDDDGKNTSLSSEPLTEALVELFASLWLTAKALRLDWVKSIRSKMMLNAKKYPAEHCKVGSKLSGGEDAEGGQTHKLTLYNCDHD